MDRTELRDGWQGLNQVFNLSGHDDRGCQAGPDPDSDTRWQGLPAHANHEPPAVGHGHGVHSFSATADPADPVITTPEPGPLTLGFSTVLAFLFYGGVRWLRKR